MKYTQLVKAIDSASTQLLGRAAAVVNQSLVIRNWTVGAYIVEFEQNGEDRARYGARLLERLAQDLTKRGLRGLDTRSLRDCRQLFQSYPQIRGTLSPESKQLGLLNLARRQPAIRGTLSPELITPLSPQLVLRFSWSQLQELIRLDDPLKRAFYENECLKCNWSVRQLQRQIGSLLFERTGLSTDKAAVLKRARTQAPQATIADLIRDPYVLEFTGLAALPEYTESELEAALLNHLQKFLLELGAGFLFEARQRRITVGNEHDYLDLVFYHRHLRCHVLLDLKIRPSASSCAVTRTTPRSSSPRRAWTTSSSSPATWWRCLPPNSSNASSSTTAPAPRRSWNRPVPDEPLPRARAAARANPDRHATQPPTHPAAPSGLRLPPPVHRGAGLEQSASSPQGRAPVAVLSGIHVFEITTPTGAIADTEHYKSDAGRRAVVRSLLAHPHFADLSQLNPKK